MDPFQIEVDAVGVLGAELAKECPINVFMVRPGSRLDDVGA